MLHDQNSNSNKGIFSFRNPPFSLSLSLSHTHPHAHIHTCTDQCCCESDRQTCILLDSCVSLLERISCSGTLSCSTRDTEEKKKKKKEEEEEEVVVVEGSMDGGVCVCVCVCRGREMRQSERDGGGM